MAIAGQESADSVMVGLFHWAGDARVGESGTTEMPSDGSITRVFRTEVMWLSGA